METVKYHTSIIDLPLRNFITCAVDGNLSALTISGFPLPEQLKEAWLDIQQQYADAIGDSEHMMYMFLMRDVGLLSIKYQTIQTIVQLLEVIRDQRFCDELNKLCDTSFAFDLSDVNQYHKELQRCINRSKSILIMHAQKDAQLQKMKGKAEGSEKITKEYYYSILITLSDKFRLTDEISVYEFCERVRRHNKELTDISDAKRKQYGR